MPNNLPEDIFNFVKETWRLKEEESIAFASGILAPKCLAIELNRAREFITQVIAGIDISPQPHIIASLLQ